MNRRGFLTQLFATAGGILVAPSIVTHGLKLKKPYVSPWIINPKYNTADRALYFVFRPEFHDFIMQNCPPKDELEIKLFKRYTILG